MTYSIGDVEDLTGVKAHILRYWEDVIPGFSPQKDMSGRRVYSQHEIEQQIRECRSELSNVYLKIHNARKL